MLVTKFHPFELRLIYTTFLSKPSANDTLESLYVKKPYLNYEISLTTKRKSFFERSFSYLPTDSLPSAQLLKRWLIRYFEPRIHLALKESVQTGLPTL
jgi:hypothetical protein